MVFKLVALIVVGFLIYVVFFKKSREEQIKKNKKNEEITDTMVECPKCNVFVSKDEAILSNGKYYCSKECLKC